MFFGFFLSLILILRIFSTLKRNSNWWKKITKNKFDDLINQYNESGFTAGALAKALEIIDSMIEQPDNSIFLALSGALVPAGQQSLIVKMINSSKINAIVSTGAMLTHDYLEDLGYKHTPVDLNQSDSELRKHGINRIYDMAALDEGFEKLELSLHQFLESKYEKAKDTTVIVPTHEFLFELGCNLSRNSILGAAASHNVPIFCPAITDSMLGVHIMGFREFFPNFILDPLQELKSFVSLCFDQKSTSAIILGGGTSKNYLLQGMLISGKELNYAVQITMDRPEHGGLSGAPLNEAISWGKIRPDAKYQTVVADVTLVLPIIVGKFFN